MPTRFSLLLPVYRADQPEHVETAFRSTVQDQLLRPDEVVIVRDGFVGPDLASTLDQLTATSPVPVRRIDLPLCGGLAAALTIGIEACAHDVIARMDADDVSLPHRFVKQIPVIEGGADLVGAAIVELDDDRSKPVVFLRPPPIGTEVIAHVARFRNPFNHPTVVYRRSAVLAAGGYRDLPLMEDYWLFARMIAGGAQLVNLPDVLVRYRVGDGAYKRKGGLRQLRSEIALQRTFHADGFTSPMQAVRNVMVRGSYRLVPTRVRRAAYRRSFTVTASAPANLPVADPGTVPNPTQREVDL